MKVSKLSKLSKSFSSSGKNIENCLTVFRLVFIDAGWLRNEVARRGGRAPIARRLPRRRGSVTALGAYASAAVGPWAARHGCR